MIIIILVNLIWMFNTSLDIYAIILGSFPNRVLDSQYKYIGMYHHIGYPIGKQGLIINTPCISELRHLYTGWDSLGFFSGTHVSDPLFQHAKKFQPTLDFISHSWILLVTI